MWVPNVVPNLGSHNLRPKSWDPELLTQFWGPKTGDPKFGPKFWNPNLWTQIWGPELCVPNFVSHMFGPKMWYSNFGTQIWGSRIWGSRIWENVGPRIWDMRGLSRAMPLGDDLTYYSSERRPAVARGRRSASRARLGGGPALGDLTAAARAGAGGRARLRLRMLPATSSR